MPTWKRAAPWDRRSCLHEGSGKRGRAARLRFFIRRRPAKVPDPRRSTIQDQQREAAYHQQEQPHRTGDCPVGAKAEAAFDHHQHLCSQPGSVRHRAGKDRPGGHAGDGFSTRLEGDAGNIDMQGQRRVRCGQPAHRRRPVQAAKGQGMAVESGRSRHGFTLKTQALQRAVSARPRRTARHPWRSASVRGAERPESRHPHDRAGQKPPPRRAAEFARP